MFNVRMSKMVDIDQVREYLNEVGLRQSSIRTILLQIKRVLINVFEDDVITYKMLKKHVNDILDWIDSDALPNYNSKKQHLNSINHLLKAYDIKNESIEQKLKDYAELSTAEQTQLKPNDKRMNLMDSVDFDEMRERMRKEKNITRKLILALYTLLPPLRQQDYLNLQVFDKAIKSKSKLPNNYIDLKNKLLVISQHKTSDSNGAKKIDLPTELITIIRKYIREEETDNKLLPMSSSNFTKYFQRHFKGLSPQVLRKAYVSQYANDMSVEERFALGRIMGHKISTSQLQYNKSKPSTTQNEDIEED